MDSQDDELFMRRYGDRILAVEDYRSMKSWIKLYKNKGEIVFLNVLEDAESYTRFGKKFYDVLRDAWNIDGEGMNDQYQIYKNKFGKNDEVYINELRNTIENFDDMYSNSAGFR